MNTSILRSWPALLRLLMTLCLLALGACSSDGSSDPAPPQISAQPSSSSVVAGASATFAVVAAGDNLSYQWQRSTDAGTTWADLPGANAASYTVAAPTAAMSGLQFRAVISGSGSRVTSSAVTLTVTAAIVAPQITVQPVAQSTLVGTATSFSVTASGTGLSYQWQSSANGTTWADLAGATGTTFNLATPAITDNGNSYRVLVSNSGGSVTSAAAQLSVNPAPAAPAITTQPSSSSVQAPQAAVFSVVANGNPAPSYQWQLSTDAGATFADLPGATGASYTTATTTLADSGKRYRVRLTNTNGQLLSAAAQLTVTPANSIPMITTQPADQSVSTPATATFSVSASGTPSPTYQWQLSTDNGATFANINGATASSYTTAATVVADSGKRFRVQVSNSAGNVTSNAATLTVSASGGSGGTTAAACFGAASRTTGFTAQVVTGNSLDAALNSTLNLRVNGPAVFQGQSATEIQADTTTATLNTTTTTKSYGNANPTTGAYTDLGSVGVITGSVGGINTRTDVTTVYTPPFTNLTFTLAVGQSVTQTATQTTTTTSTIGGVAGAPMTNVDTTTTVTQFIGQESVTVPAGTFNTCRLLITKPGETGGVTLWLLVNSGLTVKSEAAGVTTSAISITINGVPVVN